MENQPEQNPMMQQQYSSPIISVGDWVIIFIITAIPIVNIVMLFVWAFGSDTNPSKANWAKASLIFMLIGVFLYILIFVIMGVAFLGSGMDF